MSKKIVKNRPFSTIEQFQHLKDYFKFYTLFQNVNTCENEIKAYIFGKNCVNSIKLIKVFEQSLRTASSIFKYLKKSHTLIH